VTDNATLLGQAKDYHRSGRLPEAEQLYREVLLTDATNPHVLYLLGAACYGLGKASEAALFLERAVQIAPDHAEARHHLGVVYMQHGRLDDAVAQLQEAVRLSPQSPQTLQHLKQSLAASHDAAGMALVRQGRLDEARARFREALAVDPTCIAAQGNLGNVLKNQGHLDEAEACYRRVLEIAPESAKHTTTWA
jgi:Flp pilus assembly protein TadD